MPPGYNAPRRCPATQRSFHTPPSGRERSTMVTSSVRARLRVAASSAVPAFFARPSASRFESLESRVMLCSSPAELAAIGVPASIVEDDGHIRYADFVNLTPEQQAHINPHLIEAPIDSNPIDFDKILGIPANQNNAPTVGIALPDFYPSMSGGASMDLTSQSGRALLRFGTQVNNMGAGPGTFISGRPGIDAIPTGAPITSWLAPDGSQNVLQAVYKYDTVANSFALDHYNASGHFTYHAGHGHFHFDGYADYALRVRNGDGTPGAYVQRADGTGIVGAKTGFCLINVNGSFTLPNGSSSTTLTGYNGTGQPSTGCGFLQGVNVGRADVYSSSLEGQWLDVTGVAPGNYFLEIQLDSENAMQEGDDANNTKTFAVTVTANSATGGFAADQFDSNGRHNDTIATATDMGVMGTFNQTGMNINWGLDEDYFKFTASSSGTYSLSTTAANGDINLYLYDANGTQIAASTNVSGTDTVSYNFVKGQTYFAEAKCYNSTLSSNYQLTWGLKPTVDNSPHDQTVAENSRQGTYFTIFRNGPTNTPLTVPLTVGGNAVAGVDYQPLPSQIVIDANASSINVPLFPINNNVINGKRTVTLAVQTNNAYVVGNGFASIRIVDDDARFQEHVVPPVSGVTALGGTDNVFNNSGGLLGSADRNDLLATELV